MLARTESKGTTPSLLVGVQSCIDTVENNVVVPEEDRMRSIPIASCITFVYISKRRPVPTNKYFFNYLHHCCVYSIQKLETAYISLKR